MRKILLTTAIALGGLAACEPTGSSRCDAQLAQRAQIHVAGYRLNCAPDFPPVGYSDDRSESFPIWGWTDHRRQIVWVWPDEIPVREGETLLRYLLQHELGHVLQPTWSEREVDGWAWCTDPQPSVGYRWRPSEVECETIRKGQMP